MSVKDKYQGFYEKITGEFKDKFLPSKLIDNIFEVYRTDLNMIKERRSTNVSRSWFKVEAKPETYTKRAIERLFNEIGIPSIELIEEKALSSEKSIFRGKFDKYPDFMIPKGEGSAKSLLIEVERIGKRLTEKGEGIDQVRKWFGPEYEGLSEDYNALATNFSDWIFFRRKTDGYGMESVLVTPEQALEIISDTFFGKATLYSTESIEKQHDKIEKFYSKFNERLGWILKNMQGEPTKRRDIKVTGIPTHLSLNLRKEIAIRYYRTIFFRLLFIKIIEEWKLIKRDPIRIIFNQKPSYHNSLFQQLFFDIFNKTDEERKDLDLLKIFLDLPYLNGGLFRRNEFEKIYPLKLSSAGFKDIWDILKKHSFTKDETGKEFLDPEVLGYIFEKTLDASGSRKSTGSYYTPKIITDHMSRSSIESLVTDRLNTTLQKEEILNYSLENINEIEILENGIKNKGYLKLINILKDLKICDNACGSGAFLKSSADILLKIYKKVYQNFKWDLPYHSVSKIEGTRRPFNDIYELKRYILQNNLYGLDIIPTAIEICELRLWLWLIQPPEGFTGEFLIEPLPNIDYNIQIGNSLIGFVKSEELGEGLLKWMTPAVIEFQKAIKDYYNEVSNSTLSEEKKIELDELKKKAWFRLNKKLFDFHYDILPPIIKKGNKNASKRSDINNSKYAFLESLLPFHWCISMYDVISKGGFDIIIGNPPYGNIFQKGSDMICKKVFKTYNSRNPDIFHQFIEQAHRLLKKGGYISYIIPDTLLRKIQLKDLRQFFTTKTLVELIECGRVFKDVPSMQSIIIKCVKKRHNSYNHIIINSKKVEETLSIIKNRTYKVKEISFSSIENDSAYRINHYTSKTKLEIINYLNNTCLKLKEINNLAITRGSEGSKKLLKDSIENGYTEMLIPSSVERNFVNYCQKYFPLNKLTGKHYDHNKLLIIRIRNINIRPRLICAVDNLKIVCMKTLQFIYNENNKEADLFYLMSVLNSNLMEFYTLNYLTDDCNKSFLELLPLPENRDQYKSVLSLIGQYQEFLQLIGSKNSFNSISNSLVYEIYLHEMFNSNLEEQIYTEDKLFLVDLLSGILKPIPFDGWICLYRKSNLEILSKEENYSLNQKTKEISESLNYVYSKIKNSTTIQTITDKITSHSWVRKIESSITLNK